MKTDGSSVCHAYNQIEKEMKDGRMRGSTVIHMTKCHVIVTWEVLQAFLHIATIFAVTHVVHVYLMHGKRSISWLFRVYCHGLLENSAT